MFDLENDDKKKLKENMEEIKDLINQGGDEGEAPAPRESPEEADLQQGQPSQSTGQAPETPVQQEPSKPADRETAGQNTSEEFGGFQGQEMDTDTQEDLSFGEQEFESSETEQIDEAVDQIEQGLEEFEEENVPSGEAIFLTVERFKSLKDRIEEMRHLSDEIDDIVDHLQGGLDEDRNTAEDAQRLLKDFSQRRAEVEDIVLSHE